MKFYKASPIRNGKKLFRPISFDLAENEIVCLMGASGIGKSSFFSCINQCLPHSGKIEYHESFMVFQENEQFFPWLTILDNLRLVDKTGSWKQWSKAWGLETKILNYQNQCSVGQVQRFVLLRALRSKYPLLLLDEPLSGVDKETSLAICKKFKKMIKTSKKKVLWITHDHDEAQQLTSKIIFLK